MVFRHAVSTIWMMTPSKTDTPDNSGRINTEKSIRHGRATWDKWASIP
jgi:hypothetical protein